MSKLIVVTGATGMQGSGVIDALSTVDGWRIRGVTRNTASVKAQALNKRGIEMVKADFDDEHSLLDAFVGANAIFAVTDFWEPFIAGAGAEKAMQLDFDRGVKMARAASKTATLQTYFWSTLPAADEVSNGNFPVPHFDGKAKVDAYIKSDPVLNGKTIFLLVGFYGSNFSYPPFTPFYSKPAGQYIVTIPGSASSLIYSLGPVTNVGVTVSGLLQYPFIQTASGPNGGRYVHIMTGEYGFQDYYTKWAEIAGKGKVQVLSVPLEQFEGLFGMWGTELGLMVKFMEFPNLWRSSGEGDVMIDARELEWVGDRLIHTEDAWKLINWDQF